MIGNYVPSRPRNPQCRIALIVEAADLLANLRASLKESNVKKLTVYRVGYVGFRKAVYRPGLCDSIWAEIDGIMGLPNE